MKRNPNFIRIIEGRTEQRPFASWLEERLFYMCLVVAKDSGLFSDAVRREKQFVKNTLYMCPPINCYLQSRLSRDDEKRVIVCCGAAVTRQVHLNHYEIAHARIVKKPCRECKRSHVIEAGCYYETFEVPNVHLIHAFKRFLKQIKSYNYPIYKTTYSRSAARPTSVFGPPDMCVWDVIIGEFKRGGGRLEEEGEMDLTKVYFSPDREYPYPGEMDNLATPFHETETLNV